MGSFYRNTDLHVEDLLEYMKTPEYELKVAMEAYFDMVERGLATEEVTKKIF